MVMDILKAREIYANCIDGKNPKRYSKEQIYECLNVLNNAAQPIQLDRMQFLAIQDAIARANGENPRLP